MQNIKKILENNGFKVEKETSGFAISQYTPAGEDWSVYVSKLKDIKEYANNFDPEEEFSMWVEAKNHGFKGVPGIAELWQDQLWKQEILKKCAGEM